MPDVLAVLSDSTKNSASAAEGDLEATLPWEERISDQTIVWQEIYGFDSGLGVQLLSQTIRRAQGIPIGTGMRIQASGVEAESFFAANAVAGTLPPFLQLDLTLTSYPTAFAAVYWVRKDFGDEPDLGSLIQSITALQPLARSSSLLQRVQRVAAKLPSGGIRNVTEWARRLADDVFHAND